MIGCTEEYTSVTIRDTSARGKSLYSSFPRKRESGWAFRTAKPRVITEQVDHRLRGGDGPRTSFRVLPRADMGSQAGDPLIRPVHLKKRPAQQLQETGQQQA